MKKHSESGQALTEFALILALVALAAILVLSILGPAIGHTFHNVADNAVNSDVKNLGYRLTQQLTLTAAELTRSSTPTSTRTPTSTPTFTPVTPSANTSTPTPTDPPASTSTPTPTSTGTSTPTFTPMPTPAWVKCAEEGWPTYSTTSCDLTGTNLLKFGADTRWIYKVVTGSMYCDLQAWSFNDPAPSTHKACYYWNNPWTTTVTGISPNPASGPTTGGTTITINGTGLYDGIISVSFGGIAAAMPMGTCSADATHCTVISPAHSAGLVSVAVSNTIQTFTIPDGFTYLAPVPTITSFSATSGPASGGPSITISGTNFNTAGGTSFTFGTAAAVIGTCTSASSCTVTPPAYPIAGPVDVTVAVGGASTTYTQVYTYLPTITSITPSSGSIYGGDTVTITGSGYDTTPGGTTIKFDLTDLTASSSCSRVGNVTSCTVTTVLHVTPGTFTVSVKVNNQTVTGSFTFIVPAPTIDSISNSYVPAGSGPASGGDTVTIAGHDLLGITHVSFGGTDAVLSDCTSSLLCVVTTPLHAIGPVDIIVYNSSQSTTVHNAYTYIPSITSVTPNIGTIAGGTTVTIQGSGFSTTSSANKFFFGGVQGTTVNGSCTFTSCRVTTPAVTNPGAVDVMVTSTVSGQTQSGTKTGGFTYWKSMSCDVTVKAISTRYKGYYFVINTLAAGNITASWTPNNGSRLNATLSIYSGSPFSTQPSSLPNPDTPLDTDSGNRSYFSVSTSNSAVGTYTIFFYRSDSSTTIQSTETITFKGAAGPAALP